MGIGPTSHTQLNEQVEASEKTEVEESPVAEGPRDRPARRSSEEGGGAEDGGGGWAARPRGTPRPACKG